MQDSYINTTKGRNVYQSIIYFFSIKQTNNRLLYIDVRVNTSKTFNIPIAVVNSLSSGFVSHNREQK